MRSMSAFLRIYIRNWKDEKLNEVLIWIVLKSYHDRHLITNKTAGQEEAAFVAVSLTNVTGKRQLK